MFLRVASVVACALALAGGSWADEEVRVYTNEDLEALPPLTSPVIVDDEGRPLELEGAERRWAFVDDFVDRAYARIDADRAYWLERRRTAAEADAVERLGTAPRYGVPANWLFRDYAVDRAWGKREAVDRGLGGRPLRDTLFRPIVPLHARPHPGLRLRR